MIAGSVVPPVSKLPDMPLTVADVLQNVAYGDTLPVVDHTEVAYSGSLVRLVSLKKAAIRDDIPADKFANCFQVAEDVLAAVVDEQLLCPER